MKAYIKPICDSLFVAAQDILYTSGGSSADPTDKNNKPIVGGLSAPLRSIPSLRKI